LALSAAKNAGAASFLLGGASFTSNIMDALGEGRFSYGNGDISKSAGGAILDGASLAFGTAMNSTPATKVGAAIIGTTGTLVSNLLKDGDQGNE
jgi:hypothetical protein